MCSAFRVCRPQRFILGIRVQNPGSSQRGVPQAAGILHGDFSCSNVSVPHLPEAVQAVPAATVGHKMKKSDKERWQPTVPTRVNPSREVNEGQFHVCFVKGTRAPRVILCNLLIHSKSILIKASSFEKI